MSEEVFEMLCSMDRRKVELQIVMQCAPTLAGLKTSNLLILPKNMEDEARYALQQTNLSGYRLVYDRNRVVFLVFNRAMLEEYLEDAGVNHFLTEYGYEQKSFGYAMHTFQQRYEEYIKNRDVFPHEIGVFLGYPLCDVRGFIDKQGEEFLATGYWKVYGDVKNTKRLFQRFDIVKDEMICKVFEGHSVREIAQGYDRKCAWATA